MIETSIKIKIIVRPYKLHARPFEDVVDCREDFMFPRLKLPDRNLQPSIRIRMHSEVFPVDCEFRPYAHSVDDQDRVLHRLVERECAAVESSAALHVPRWHHVVASRHDNRIRHLARTASQTVRDLFKAFPLLEPERPASAKIYIGKGAQANKERCGRAENFHNRIDHHYLTKIIIPLLTFSFAAPYAVNVALFLTVSYVAFSQSSDRATDEMRTSSILPGQDWVAPDPWFPI